MLGGMRELLLVIGNRNFSSWSLRAWLAIEQTGAPFELEQIWFDEDEDRARRLRRSPAGKVPILLHGDLTVWDSLAIVEYLAELFPEAGLWPVERAAHARARSLCSEMHSGFFALREELPMNCRAKKPARDRSPAVAADIARVIALWDETRREFGAGGDFLFGRRTAADAFFAPVASRFRTYSIPLDGAAGAYCQAILSMPAMRAWLEAAQTEGHDVPAYGDKT